MIAPQLTPDEPFRLAALRATNMLDSPLEERFERITRLTCRSLGVPIATISLVDAGRQWFKSSQGMKACETSRDISFCGHTILQDDGIMVVPDARKDPRFIGNPLLTGDPPVIFYAGVSLRTSDGSRIGVMCACDSKPREMTEEDIAIMRDLASMAENELTSSVANSVQADLLSEIAMERRRALIDPLTRLWNREGIANLLEHTIKRARENDAPVCLILADLDHFKRINDTLGHLVGDEVLRQAAKRMLAAIRSNDAIGRFGGEEFLIVLDSCSNAEEALAVCERLRQTLASTPLIAGEHSVSATMSLGAAFVEAVASSDLEITAILDSADQALYRAKNAGRNRTEINMLATMADAA